MIAGHSWNPPAGKPFGQVVGPEGARPEKGQRSMGSQYHPKPNVPVTVVRVIVVAVRSARIVGIVVPRPAPQHPRPVPGRLAWRREAPSGENDITSGGGGELCFTALMARRFAPVEGHDHDRNLREVDDKGALNVQHLDHTDHSHTAHFARTRGRALRAPVT